MESGTVVRTLARTRNPSLYVDLVESQRHRGIRRLRSIPSLSEIGRIMDLVSRFLIVYDNQDATRVSKLVLVSVHSDHSPADTVICAQEGIAFLVRQKMLSY